MRRRRRGEIITVELSGGDGGATPRQIPLEFPERKDDLERSICEGFISTYESSPIYPTLRFHSVEQGPENGLDFRVVTNCGDRWLELMEIAPFQLYGGSPDDVPSAHNGYQIAKFVHDGLMKKSRKYRARTGDEIILLLYITDWRFSMGRSALAILQYWCNRRKHSFEHVFTYMPAYPHGIIEVVSPTPPEYWKGFDPESYSEIKTTNIDPRAFKVVS